MNSLPRISLPYTSYKELQDCSRPGSELSHTAMGTMSSRSPMSARPGMLRDWWYLVRQMLIYLASNIDVSTGLGAQWSRMKKDASPTESVWDLL